MSDESKGEVVVEKREAISIKDLCCDDGVQVRVSLDQDAVNKYGQFYLDGIEMGEPRVVRTPEGINLVWDGAHRREGARKAGLEKLWCLVRPGTYQDACLLALTANRHGVHYKPEDWERLRERAVLLRPTSTDVALAALCSCQRATIRSTKRKLAQAALEKDKDLSDDGLKDYCGIGIEDMMEVRRAILEKRRVYTVSSPAERRDKQAARDKAAASATSAEAGAEAQPTTPAEQQQQEEKKPSPGTTTKKAAAPHAPVPVLDRLNREVPDGLRDVFSSTALKDFAAEIRMLLAKDQVRRLAKRIEAYKVSHPRMEYEKTVKPALFAALEQLEVAAEEVAAAVPYAVCPVCDGTGVESSGGQTTCVGCLEVGFVDEYTYRGLAHSRGL